MVGFLGFIILAVGGGGLALYMGVPPVFIGAYVVGLVLIGAVTGFGDGSSGSSSGSGGSSGGGGSSSNGSGSFLNSMADTASGIASNLSGSGNSGSSSQSSREVGSVSTTDPDGRREVGSLGNTSESSPNENVTPVSEHHGDDERGTTGEDYINEDEDNSGMDLFGDDAAEEEDKELHELVQALDQKEEMEKQEIKYDEDLKRKISQVIKELEDYLQHKNRIENIVGQSGEITVGEIMQHGDELGQDLRAMNGDLKELKQDLTDVKNEIGEEERVHSNVNKAEEAEEELMDHILQQEQQLEVMEEKLSKVINGKVQME